MLLAPYIFYTTSSVPHRTFRGIPHTNFKNTAYVWTCSSQYTFGILYFFLHFIIFLSFIYHILNERLRITCGCGEKTCCENGGRFDGRMMLVMEEMSTFANMLPQVFKVGAIQRITWYK